MKRLVGEKFAIQREENMSAEIVLASNGSAGKSRRRVFFGLLLLLSPLQPALAEPKIGDDEWFRRFRIFVKFFNSFVVSLNDGKLDLSTWRRMREAWKNIDCG